MFTETGMPLDERRGKALVERIGVREATRLLFFYSDEARDRISQDGYSPMCFDNLVLHYMDEKTRGKCHRLKLGINFHTKEDKTVIRQRILARRRMQQLARRAA